MNQREKVLVALFSVAIVAFGGKSLIGWYRGQQRDLAKDHTRLIDRRDRLEAELRAIANRQHHWQTIGGQTLSVDEKEARRLWRDRLVDLAHGAKLTEAKPDLGMRRKLGKKGLLLINSTVNAKGSLEQIKQFLFDLHREPYIVRCKSLTLTPIMTKPPRTGGRSAKPGANVPQATGQFTMAVKLETLLLPMDKDAPPFKTVDMTRAGKETPKRAQMPMLAELGDYDAIKRDLFERFVRIEPPTKASATSPGNGGKVQLPDPKNFTIRWRTGQRAKTHVLHFGPSAKDLEKVDELPTTSWKVTGYELAIDKTFYWRVDEIGEGGTTTGDVWSFTLVEKAPPGPPDITKPPPAQPIFPNLTVRGVLSSARVQQVVLANPGNANEADKRLTISEKLNLGRVIYIDPTGAVTEEADGTRRFHAVGTRVKDGQVLSQADFPRVFHELAKLEKDLAGTRGSE